MERSSDSTFISFTFTNFYFEWIDRWKVKLQVQDDKKEYFAGYFYKMKI